MEERMRNELQERILKQMEIIQDLQEKGEDARKAIAELKVLYEIENKNAEISVDWNKECQKLELEEKKLDLEERKFAHTKKVDKANVALGLMKLGVDMTSIIAPLEFGDNWLNDSFDFETKGYLSSSTSRNVVSKLVSNVFKK